MPDKLKSKNTVRGINPKTGLPRDVERYHRQDKALKKWLGGEDVSAIGALPKRMGRKTTKRGKLVTVSAGA